MTNPLPKPWHTLSEEQALQEQQSSKSKGLSHDDIAQRRAAFGYNKLEEFQSKSILKIIWTQFSDLLVVVLIGAALIAGFLGEPLDTIAILTIVILNALLGFFQEYRAERTVAALRKLTAPLAKVRRMGETREVAAYELVPGDIVLLEAGKIVPADLRIIESYQLAIDESPLTGESQPVLKSSSLIAQAELHLSDQTNMAFKGTLVTLGRGVAIVIGTGMNTEIGRIAHLLKKEVEVKTPLQNRIAAFAKILSLAVAILCGLIFSVGLLRGEPIILMFMTALSLAVAAIPEALPAVITMALAIGARTMGQKNALVRKLSAVEALGSVTYICCDKTGTLTQNQMQPEYFLLNGELHSEIPKDWSNDTSWPLLANAFALNNDITITSEGHLQGDPTETALAQIAIEMNLDLETLKQTYPRVAELPFSSDRAMMTTVHQSKDKAFVMVKGAPERVLPLCRFTYVDQTKVGFNDSSIEDKINDLAAKGYRLLAFAHKELPTNPDQMELIEFEKELVLLGVVALIDPPRPEAKAAIALCRSAGIQVVMITGDHPKTATAIAQKLDLLEPDRNQILSGTELSRMSDEELEMRIHKIAVYARVLPEQKIRIVKALQLKGEIVSMTGDGVNDAAALKRADIGVSMGKGGTDVAREASHMILLDDNFATIVSAVREGRRIYDNIRKFIRFVLSGNSGEMATLFLAPLFGLPIPLLPIQILWVNLVTDGLPGLALAVEPEERKIMKRPPRRPNESVFAHGLWQHTVWVGGLTALVTLGTAAWGYHSGSEHWRSMAFMVLTLIQLGHVLAIRSEKFSLFSIGIGSNLPLLGAVLLTFLLQLATLYIPQLNSLLKTEPLPLRDLLICIASSSIVFIAVEIEKSWYRYRDGKLH